MEDVGESKKLNHAIFIDKNHSPAHFKKAIEQINGFCPSNVDLKLVAVTPKCLNQFSFKFKDQKI